MKKDESTAAVAVGCISVLIAIMIAAPLRAWCLIQIYDWHLRPVIGGPTWSVFQVWGILCFIQLLLPQGQSATKKVEQSFSEQAYMLLFMAVGWPLLTLLVARLLK